ncbi:putative transporter [Rodentibacter pneumotropicus]|uniref:Putative transporter n=1 Tax=Rodentibacter pneumotropicus TaxID=758 RepID=A0A448MKG9_9PAST|nr:putative transporter [Rodentibacter pneumotropicus]
MWGVLMSVVAIVLMKSGGLANLQTMTLMVALPFAVLMLVMCFSLWKGLNADKNTLRLKLIQPVFSGRGKNGKTAWNK